MTAAHMNSVNFNTNRSTSYICEVRASAKYAPACRHCFRAVLPLRSLQLQARTQKNAASQLLGGQQFETHRRATAPARTSARLPSPPRDTSGDDAMAGGRGGGHTRRRRAALHRGSEERRDGQTRTFDVRIVLSLVAATPAVPQWMTAADSEAPVGVWPLVEAVQRWLERTGSAIINAVEPHDLDALARAVAGAVRVAVPVASDHGAEYLRVTHQVYCPMQGARWTACCHAAVSLLTAEEFTWLLPCENPHLRQILDVFPDVCIRHYCMAAVVTADSRRTVDAVAREMQAILYAARVRAGGAASELVVHSRECTDEDWQELRHALLEADAEWLRHADL